METSTHADYIEGLRSRLEIATHAFVHTPEISALFAELRNALDTGMVRVAEPVNGAWIVNAWVRKALLASVQAGTLAMQTGPFPGTELDTMPWRNAPFPGCRIPAGSYVRHGAHLEPGVTVMPGTVIHMGAFIGAGTMIDSHVMVGACAQIGRGVNIGCQTAIGGILLPLEASPNIIEDEVVLGYNCGVFDGVRIGAGSVIAANTTISGLAGVYDAVDKVWLRYEAAGPLTIPPGSVVTMGIQDLDAEAPVVRTLVPVIVDRRS